jgi:hypothetical protein
LSAVLRSDALRGDRELEQASAEVEAALKALYQRLDREPPP